MKVISQLARHFWHRGTLAPEQVEYLVGQGFVRGADLGLADVLDRPAQAEDRKIVAAQGVTVEDELHAAGDALARRLGRRGRRGRGTKHDVTSVRRLRSALGREFERRSVALEALCELARPLGFVDNWVEAAVALRHASDEELCDALRRFVDDRPRALDVLWNAVDSETFENLFAGPAACGAPARAFAALLQTHEPARLGKYVWILTLPEVALVANLLALEARLTSVIKAL